MAKKKELAADVIKRLKAVGIKATNEEAAREKLLEALKKIGVEGMESENTISLLDMVEGFGEENEEEPEEEDESEEEEETEEEVENDALAEEVAEEEDESEEEADEEESEPEEEEEEETEDVKPAPKKKSAPASKKEEKSKKSSQKKEASPRKSVRLQPKNNKEDLAEFDVFHDIFPTDQFLYAPVVSGITIKHKGKNSNRGIITIDGCSRNANGEVICNVYFLMLAKKLQILDENDIEYELCWSGAPFCKKITLTQAKEIIESINDSLLSMVTKVDKKLGESRDKMLDDLKKSSKKSAAKSSKKVETPEPEEEEEEVKPAPKKKATVASKKPATKKKK